MQGKTNFPRIDGFVKIDNLCMLSFKNNNFDAEMNHDSWFSEDSKDLKTVIINSDSKIFNVSKKNKWIIEQYFMQRKNPSAILRITR